MALRGGVAAGLAQLVKVLVQFGSVIVLARLLEPEDFGLMAALSPLFAFIAMFQDLGLKEALYQRDEVSSTLVDQVYHATLRLGVGCALVVACASPLLSWFYGEPRLLAMTLVSSVSVLLSSWATVPTALLNRQLAFGTLAMVDIVASLLGFAATLLGALLGARHWSLLFGPLASTLAILVISWRRAGFARPAAGFAGRPRGLRFGANLHRLQLPELLRPQHRQCADRPRLRQHSEGFYDRAYKLLLFPLQTVNQPLSRVMVPLLSRMRTSRSASVARSCATVGQLGW